jgi:3-hydroxyacyl-CoA dehydrogenase
MPELVNIKVGSLPGTSALLATNTSSLTLESIATALQAPQRLVGLHFFNPVAQMPLVEVVHSVQTDAEALAAAQRFARQLDRLPLPCRSSPGFLVNRVLAPYLLEAFIALEQGIAPEVIDAAATDFGMPMGPFAMSDLAGLDLGWSAATSQSATIRDVLCEKGRRGQKTSAGYYDYDEARKAHPSEVTRGIITDFMQRAGHAHRDISDTEILERCLFAMINEACKILDEGIAIRASDIDVVWVNGYGWPVYRGGPMHYADNIGRQVIADKLKAYGPLMGADFQISAALEGA